MVITGLIGVYAVGGLLQSPIEVKHYQIIERSKSYVIVKINPRAYKPELFFNKSDKEADFAINTSYSWKNRPIGWLKYIDVLGSMLKYESIRPCLSIDFNNNYKIKMFNQIQDPEYTLIFQAGPTLLLNGKNVFNESYVKEKFQPDVKRITSHTAIGVYDNGKIALLYTPKASLADVAKKFISIGVKDAMNFDGGSKSALKIGNHIYGNPNPFVGLQLFGVY